jgi:predicted neutral ceramidase superfamily lipid hydrolase
MSTTDTFWNQMGLYNEATFSVQIIMVAIAMILTYFVFAKSGTKVNTLMKIFLSFAFAWNGIVFFLVYAKNSISIFLGTDIYYYSNPVCC